MSLYSARLLFKSTNIPHISGSFYEDSIVLIKGNSEEEVVKSIEEYYKPYSYENSENGTTYIELVEILDIFEIMEDLQATDAVDFKEVYSRFLIFEENDITKEDVLKKYNEYYGM